MTELRKISQEELAEIIRKHALWCRGATGGEKANLTSANLTYANLTSANLRYANLTSANLTYANLTSANLTYANLTYANLTYANLRYADLAPIKNDLIASILRLPNEIEFLRTALIEGKIDGSSYTGECACLAGTMAHACNVNIAKFEADNLMPVDANSPRERWFLAINTGDTPETSAVSKITLKWVDEAIAMVERIRKTAPEVVVV